MLHSEPVFDEPSPDNLLGVGGSFINPENSFDIMRDSA